MDTIKGRDACKNCEAGNSMEESNGSRDKTNITATTAEGSPATTRMPEIVETSQQSILASAETPTAQYGRQQLMSFHGNMPKSNLSIVQHPCLPLYMSVI
jgi:hypothetical protein